MAQDFKIEVKGLADLQKELKKFGVAGVRETAAVTTAIAKGIERDAITNIKQKVNQRTGHLSRSMDSEKLDEQGLHWRVYSFARYAAYVEFGTRRSVEVPEEMIEVASPFMANPLVRPNNLPARPFLYPAFVKGRRQFIKELEKSLEILASKV